MELLFSFQLCFLKLCFLHYVVFTCVLINIALYVFNVVTIILFYSNFASFDNSRTLPYVSWKDLWLISASGWSVWYTANSLMTFHSCCKKNFYSVYRFRHTEVRRPVRCKWIKWFKAYYPNVIMIFNFVLLQFILSLSVVSEQLTEPKYWGGGEEEDFLIYLQYLSVH